MPGDDLMGNSSIIQTDAQNGELAAPLLEEYKYGIEYLGIPVVWHPTDCHGPGWCNYPKHVMADSSNNGNNSW